MAKGETLSSSDKEPKQVRSAEDKPAKMDPYANLKVGDVVYFYAHSNANPEASIVTQVYQDRKVIDVVTFSPGRPIPKINREPIMHRDDERLVRNPQRSDGCWDVR